MGLVHVVLRRKHSLMLAARCLPTQLRGMLVCHEQILVSLLTA